MTRDEAISIVSKGAGKNASLSFSSGGFVELLELLSVLKLEAPPPISERAWAGLSYLTKMHVSPADIEKVLALYGLKIVEK